MNKIWFVMLIVLPLAPVVLLVGFILLSKERRLLPSLVDVLRNGQLFFLSSALAGVAGYELIALSQLDPQIDMGWYTIAVIVVAFLSIPPAAITACCDFLKNADLNDKRVAYASLAITLFAVCVATLTHLFAVDEEKRVRAALAKSEQMHVAPTDDDSKKELRPAR